MLEYTLRENPLTGRDDDFAAYPVNNDSYDKERFLKLMMQRGTTVSMTDALAVLNNIEETALYIISNGGTINLPLFFTRFSITGVFDGPMDSFDPLRHRLHVRVGKGSLLHKAEKSVTLSKVHTPPPLPLILEVIDSVSGKANTILTPGGVVEIEGARLRIAGSNPDVGLYFVASDGSETKSPIIIHNMPSTLMALIPPLPPGPYHIKLTTQYNKDHLYNKSKTTVFHHTLQVQ